MLLTGIKIENFRNIPYFEQRLGPGVWLIKGANEAGKSSFLNALIFGLFEDPKSRSERIKVFKRWNTDQLYKIRAEFEEGGQKFSLEKDFEHGKAKLSQELTGKSWSDKTAIGQMLSEFFGLSTERAFLSTACIKQGEMSDISGGEKDVRGLLLSRITGSAVESIDTVIGTIDKHINDLERGLKGHPAKYPGKILNQKNQIEAVEANLSNVRSIVDRRYKAQSEYDGVSKKCDECTKQLGDKKTVYQKAKEFFDAEGKLANFSQDLQEVDRQIKSIKKVKNEKRKAEADVQKAQQLLKKLQRAYGGHKEYIELLDKVSNERKDLASLEGLLSKVRVIDSQITKLRESLEKMAVINHRDVERAEQLQFEIAVCKNTLKQMSVDVKLEPLRELSLTFQCDGVPGELRKNKGQHFQTNFSQRLLLEIKGVANLDATSTNPDVQKTVKKIRQADGELTQLLSKHDCKTVTDLRKKKEAREEVEGQIKLRESERGGVLSGRSEKDVKAQATKLKAAVKLREKKLHSLRRYAISIPEFQAEEKNIDELKEKKVKAEERVKSHGMYLSQNRSVDQLSNKRQKLASDKMDARHEVNNLRKYKLSSEQFVQIERQIGGLSSTVEDLKTKKIEIESYLRDDRYGDDDIAKLEEKIEEATKQLISYEWRLKALSITKDLIREAEARVIENTWNCIRDRTAELFADLTEERYSKINREGEGFKFFAWSNEKADWVDIDGPEPSGGVRDQFYLAARLALAEASSGGRWPLILDEPLVYFDKKRRGKAFDLLKRLAQKQQVIILSCHDFMDPITPQIINIPLAE